MASDPSARSENESYPVQRSGPRPRGRLVTDARFQVGFGACLVVAQLVGAAAYQALLQLRIPAHMDSLAPYQRSTMVDAILDETLRTTLTITLLMGALMFGLGIWYSNRLVGPLPRLIAALRQLGSGNFDVRLKARPGDLICGVADEFNRAAEGLSARGKRPTDHLDEAELTLG